MAKVHFKVTSWEEVIIDDELIPEVIEQIKSGDIKTSNDLINEYDDDVVTYNGHIAEVETQMTPEENGGYATIEVVSDDYHEGKLFGNETEDTNIIANIKRIINTYGSFNVSDLESNTSPCITSAGETNVLAEHFYPDGVDAETYIHGVSTGEEFIEYEQLDDSVIDEIETLALEWEATCQKTQKRVED